MIRINLVVCLLMIPTTQLFSQSGSWQDDINKVVVNIYDLQQKFDDEWSDKEIVKGHGYKQFQRWMDFMEPRCFPSGDKFSPDALLKAQQEDPSLFLMPPAGDWQYIGNTSVPTGTSGGRGAGRINRVKEFANQPGVWYACAPSGGVWKSEDSGVNWSVLGTDYLPGIGASDIAMDPTNPSVLYIASGDSDSGNTYSLGLLKSTDGGSTWNSTGLSYTVQQFYYVSRVLISETDPNLLHVASSAGLFRSTDAGSSFVSVLGGDMREVHHSYGTAGVMFALDNDFGYFRSTDYGLSWTQISAGLPTSSVSRMALAQSPANSNYVYIVATGTDSGLQGIYRSTDEGLTFEQTSDNTPNVLSFETAGAESGGQGWYDLAICCDPTDENKVYIGGINIWKTLDGGFTWVCATDFNDTPFLPYVHADIHSIQFIPGQTSMLIGNDGGVHLFDGMETLDVSGNLAISQTRAFGASSASAEYIISGSQDTGVNLKDNSTFTNELGSDGMECIIHPENPDVIYASIQNGQIYRSLQGAGGFGLLVGSGGTGVNENGSFITPYSLGDTPNKIYVGKSKVYKSYDSGVTFTPSAGFGAGPIRKLAVAHTDQNRMYASKNNSLYKSTNGNNFAIVPGTPNMFISDIEVSADNANELWITFSGFNSNAKVYYSNNAGVNWTNLSAGLPNVPVNTIVSQKAIPGAIYVGTDIGVFYRDDTTNGWIPFQQNLPNVIISELDIHYKSQTLIAATYGRGLWSSPLQEFPLREAGITKILYPQDMACSLEIHPIIVIENEGAEDLTQVVLSVTSDEGYTTNFQWNGNIPFGDTAHISLNTLTYAVYGSHTLTITLIDLNGLGLDNFLANNSKTNEFNIPGNGLDIPLLLTYQPLCSAIGITLSLTDEIGNNLTTFEPMTDFTTLETNFCVEDGCYNFIIDGEGSSISCNSLGGSIQDLSSNTEVLDIVTDVSQLAVYSFCAGDVVYGCTNPMACNYQPEAQSNDGSCIYVGAAYELNITTDNWGYETSWEILDNNDVIIASNAPLVLSSMNTFQWFIPLNAGCYRLKIYDSFGDGIFAIHGGDFSFYDNDGNLLFGFSEFDYEITYSFCIDSINVVPCEELFGCMNPAACNYVATAQYEFGECLFPGCSNPLACNYNIEAGCDDGSCLFPGCMHFNACNYNPSAGCDDGSCDFSCLPPCPGDFDHSGAVSISDFIFFLAGYGCVANCGEIDLDESGTVNISDLLEMIGYLGTICPE